jgi:hypothetical protein
MDEKEKNEALQEWLSVLKDHPRFARAFLAQQAILIEAVELGDYMIQDKMCRLIALGFRVPFLEYWRKRCGAIRVPPGAIPDCLISRDPRECFEIQHEGEWFDDPFPRWQTGSKTPDSAFKR